MRRKILVAGEAEKSGFPCRRRHTGCFLRAGGSIRIKTTLVSRALRHGLLLFVLCVVRTLAAAACLPVPMSILHAAFQLILRWRELDCTSVSALTVGWGSKRVTKVRGSLGYHQCF